MPLIHGVGDEVLLTALVVACPTTFLFAVAVRNSGGLLTAASCALGGILRKALWFFRWPRGCRTSRRAERLEDASRRLIVDSEHHAQAPLPHSCAQQLGRVSGLSHEQHVLGSSGGVNGLDGRGSPPPSSPPGVGSTVGVARGVIEWSGGTLLPWRLLRTWGPFRSSPEPLSPAVTVTETPADAADDGMYRQAGVQRGTPAGDSDSPQLQGGSGRASSEQGQDSRCSGEPVPPTSEICSVCRDAFVLPCQANCSHWFCGECIVQVWRHSPSSPLSPTPCPICRRPITLLLPSHPSSWNIPSSASSSESVPAAAPILQSIAQYNRTFGGGPLGLWQRLLDMPLLLRRLGAELSDARRAIRMLHNARVVFCVLLVFFYVLSPFDFIPEALVGFLGIFDDLLLVLCLLFYLSILYRAMLVSGTSYFSPSTSQRGSTRAFAGNGLPPSPPHNPVTAAAASAAAAMENVVRRWEEW